MLSIYLHIGNCSNFTEGGYHGMKSKIHLCSVSGVTSFQQILLRSWILLEASQKMSEMKGRIMLQNCIGKNVAVSIQRHWSALALRSLNFFSVGEGTGQETVNHSLEKLSQKISWDQKDLGCLLSLYGMQSPWKYSLKENCLELECTEHLKSNHCVQGIT